MKNLRKKTKKLDKRYHFSKLKKLTSVLVISVFGFFIIFLFNASIPDSKQKSTYVPIGEYSNQTNNKTNEATNTQNVETSPQSDTLDKPVSTQQQSGTDSSVNSNNQTTCTRTEIPYNTTYRNDPYLQKGQTKVIVNGTNGFIHDCGNGPITIKPVDSIINVGTGLTDEEIEQQKIEAQQEYDIKYSQWFATYNNAYQTCINSLPSSYQLRDSFCRGQASQTAGPPPQSP